MQNTVIDWAATSNRHRNPRALNPATAEVFGARFVRALGIGAPPEVKIIDQAERPSDWILKRKIETPPGTVLAVKKVPRAISLTWLRKLYRIQSEPSTWSWDGQKRGAEKVTNLLVDYYFGDCGAQAERMQQLLALGKDANLADPAKFHADFDPTARRSEIVSAIQWNSEPMLRVHAARLLLGTTAAHAGNVLVDADARLYSVDHEIVIATNSTDIEMLAAHLKTGTAAHRIVCEMTRRASAIDLSSLFENLPDLPWPLSSKQRTVAYFQRRLALFQKHFPV